MVFVSLNHGFSSINCPPKILLSTNFNSNYCDTILILRNIMIEESLQY